MFTHVSLLVLHFIILIFEMAFGGAGLGAGEEKVFDLLLDIPLPKDVEDIDFAIDYYKSAKDFLKIANSNFPDSTSEEKRYREPVSIKYLPCLFAHPCN